MAIFRVERNKGYTVMSNHHLRNKELTLKAKGLLSQRKRVPTSIKSPFSSDDDCGDFACWEVSQTLYKTERKGANE